MKNRRLYLYILAIITVVLILTTFDGDINSHYMKVDPSLDKAIREAILIENKTLSDDVVVNGEGHLILGIEIKKNKTIVYALIATSQFGFENNTLVSKYGRGSTPARLTFKHMNNQYELEEYLLPKDGSSYQPSIEKMIPYQYLIKIKDSGDIELLEKQQFKYAKNYLKDIDRDAKVKQRVNHKYADIYDNETSNYLMLNFDQYPYWIGTLERIHAGDVHIFEQRIEKEGMMKGKVFLTRKDQEGNILEETVFQIKNGKIIP